MTLLVDLVIAFILAEAAFLTLRHRRTGRGEPPVRTLPNLAAGFFLLLALRVALGGGGIWIAACLGGSGIAHALDGLARQRR